MMRQTSYRDTEGRNWAVLLPEDVPDSEAAQGVPVGPPSLDPLGLPLDLEVRLHNQLFDRGLLTFRDLKKRRPDVQAALMATLKVDVGRIAALYADD